MNKVGKATFRTPVSTNTFYTITNFYYHYYYTAFQTHSMLVCTAEAKLCQSSSVYALAVRPVQVYQVRHHTDAKMPIQLE